VAVEKENADGNLCRVETRRTIVFFFLNQQLSCKTGKTLILRRSTFSQKVVFLLEAYGIRFKK
jgi:hypothetical protein